MSILRDYSMAYCYSDKCPARTKDDPSPKGGLYHYNEKPICPYCGKIMTRVCSLWEEE